MFELNIEHKVEVEHRAGVAFTLREANHGEAYTWRRREGAREIKQRRLHLARLKRLGWTEEEFLELQAKNSEFLTASDEHYKRLRALTPPAPAEDGEAVEESAEAREAREAKARELGVALERDVIAPWQPIAQRFQLYQDEVSGEDLTDLSDVQHTLDLVLLCTLRLEGVTAGGQVVEWAKLDEPQRRDVLAKLLGPTIAGINTLNLMARTVTQGLTPSQKKA